MTSLAPHALFAAMLALPGCLVVSDRTAPAPTPTGRLSVEWTLRQAADPLECDLMRTDRFELVVYDRWGDLVLEMEPRCEDFFVSVDLPEGLYAAEATLVDSFDRAATVTELLEDVEIIADTDLVISVDYPIGSFL